MRLQISSGQGPAECELAAGKLLEALQKEFPSLTEISRVSGKHPGCIRSVMLETNEDLSFLEGTVKWQCVSPYRPKHKRKNWFVDISVCGEDAPATRFDEELVRFETFRSGGHGG